MARVTVTDCLEHVDNRFQLVLIASKRARQLILGAEPKVEPGNDKPTVLALREIAAGEIGPSILEEPTEPSDPHALFDTGEELGDATAGEDGWITANPDDDPLAHNDESGDPQPPRGEPTAAEPPVEASDG